MAIALVAAGSIAGSNSQSAFAADYPSWDDVKAARASEAATQTEIRRIEALLETLRVEVERTQADAVLKGTLAQEADQKFQEATIKAGKLLEQAEAASALAEQSKQRAGEIVAQQYRNGNGDVTTNLFVNAAKADDLLYSYGMADKLTEQTASIYEKAVLDANTAQALTDQADVAQDLLEGLKAEADAALEAANIAADAAAAAVTEQENNTANLTAQLAVLTERRQVTEADYQTGVEVRAAAERERQRLAAIAAAAAAAANGGGGGGGGGGTVAGSGWAKPASGGISSGFGYRLNPYSHVWRLHGGTDIAGGCGTPIYAGHSGTVVYSGWYGDYGNYIKIDNGDGTSTAYGHIVNGGLLVGRGAKVSAGQNIARIGTTGGSTGCHLHYEVLVGGAQTDPVPFMRDRGITLG